MNMEVDANIKLREIHLTAYALGELEEPDRTRLETELLQDEEGRAFVQEVRETSAMLSDELMRESGPGLTEIHRLAIAGHFQDMMGAEGEAAEHTVERRKRFSWIVGMSAAAMFMLAALTGIMYATYQYTTQFLHSDNPLVAKQAEPNVTMLASVPTAQGPYSRSGGITVDNPFVAVKGHPASPLPVQISDRAYQNIRRLVAGNKLPARNAVRIEELVNAFDYESIAATSNGEPFAAGGEVHACPWNPDHQLARIAIRSANGKQAPQLDAQTQQVAIANDVAFGVEFNPVRVAAFRLIGYENRPSANASAKTDRDVRSGYTLCALYEIVPVGQAAEKLELESPAQQLRYQTPRQLTEAALRNEWLSISVRYRLPGADHEASKLARFVVDGKSDADVKDAESADFRFAAAVASFGMILRDSPYKAQSSFDRILKLADESLQRTPAANELQLEQRRQFVALVLKTRQLQARVQ